MLSAPFACCSVGAPTFCATDCASAPGQAAVTWICTGVEPGEGRIISSMKKHEASLNKECTAALKDTGLWDLGSN
ncbi:MAG: hypothetical protein LJE83_14385 [Gammaproteobacteria bacterium]|jgi:hypothetical protein|nr:hypothetical protein [Gammaproteobacteria bacterium]